MKTLFRNGRLLRRSNSGFSIPELVISLGLVSLIGAGLALVTKMYFDQVRKSYIKDEYSAYKFLITSQLAREEICKDSLARYNQNFDPTAINWSKEATHVPITLYDPSSPRKDILAKKDLVVKDFFKVKSFRVTRAVKLGVDGNGFDLYSTNIRLDIENLRDKSLNLKGKDFPVVMAFDSDNNVSGCYGEEKMASLCQMIGETYDASTGTCTVTDTKDVVNGWFNGPLIQYPGGVTIKCPQGKTMVTCGVRPVQLSTGNGVSQVGSVEFYRMPAAETGKVYSSVTYRNPKAASNKSINYRVACYFSPGSNDCRCSFQERDFSGRSGSYSPPQMVIDDRYITGARCI